MNLKYSLVFLCILCCLCCTQQAGAQTEQQTITLMDGSVIKGQIVGASGSDFVIKTSNLGTISIPQSQVSEISRQSSGAQQGNQPAVSANAMASSQQMQQMQSMLMSNPKIMETVQELLTDPEVVALLEDPEVSKAVQNGADPTSLMSNPAFMKIMSHPKIQAVIQEAVMEMMDQGALTP